MNDILNRIAQHDETGQRLDEELLAERDSVQAKIEQMQAYRLELDAVIRQRGIHPKNEEYLHTPTNNPQIVKRTRRENEEYIASVPIEPKNIGSISQIIRTICSDGQPRTKAELFDAIAAHRPGIKRSTVDAIIPSLNLQSSKDTRHGSHAGTRVYWLPVAN